MVQDDSHPVASRVGRENRAEYGRQDGPKGAVNTIGNKNGYERQGEPHSTLPQGRQGPLARTNGGVAQEPPPSQRQGTQSQSFLPKPNSNQAQGSQPQSSMLTPISTQSQGRMGGPTFHQGPSPTQPLTEGGRNQPHPTSTAVKPPHVLAFGNDTESRRKPYDGHDFEHHDWLSGASHEPKTVPSALHLDHMNGYKERNKLQTRNEKPLASTTTENVPEKPSIQVNVNVFYDQDGNFRVDSTPHQTPRRTPPSVSAPPPPKRSPIRPPPPKSGSSGCCSIL